MEYQLVRSRRKTIAICIDKEGNVIVRAPLRAAQNTIDRFVNEKQAWITEKSTQMETSAAVRENFTVAVGSTLPLRGRDYPVVLGEQVAFTGTSFTIPMGDFAVLKPRIIDLYKTLAQKVILESTAYFSKRSGLLPVSVRIGSANTYWGSCSGKNRLHFSWKLVMAESEVIDYVVVHELCHTVEHNHSARFWRLVEGILPEYKKDRTKLNQLAKKLHNQDWS